MLTKTRNDTDEYDSEAVTDALDSLDIDYEITEHPPVYTIDEMKNLGITHKGDVVKNLFLRDAKGKTPLFSGAG